MRIPRAGSQLRLTDIAIVSGNTKPILGRNGMNMLARSALIACLSAVVLSAAAAARAADYPVRPIKFVVPYAAGGPTDVLGRVVADFVGRDLRQAIVVENKPGAQGAIAAEMVAHADPDGYTLFVAAGSIVVLNPLLYKKLSYDPVKDFRMLAVVTEVPVVMEVHPSVPAKTIAEFVAYAKQNPGKLNFGSAGTGGTIHLAGEMFKQMAGIEMTHVPYKGAAPALTDLISGNIQVMFESISTSLPPIRSGLLRPLGISSAQRVSDLPEIPTIAESGYPDYRVSVWFGIAAPAKLPEVVAKILSDSLSRAMSDDGFRASLEKIGYSVLRPRSAAAIAEYVDADRLRWSNVIKAQNISLD
jgi:tripartite-type tricarboxylate transporter receptor subunit TctC